MRENVANKCQLLIMDNFRSFLFKFIRIFLVLVLLETLYNRPTYIARHSLVHIFFYVKVGFWSCFCYIVFFTNIEVDGNKNGTWVGFYSSFRVSEDIFHSPAFGIRTCVYKIKWFMLFQSKIFKSSINK